MARRLLRSLALGLLCSTTIASPSVAGGWFDPPAPPPQPPPIHVYDYTRGPVWTPNGWAQVPVEVHFPRTAPTVVVPPQNMDPQPRGRPMKAARRSSPKAASPYPDMPVPKLPPMRKGTLK